jgi:two-component system response regulator FixJ
MEAEGNTSFVSVVEDESALREAIGNLLRSAGFTVASFASAEDFLSSRWHPTLCLVLDVGLPGMSGLDLQQHLRRGSDSLCPPIIFVSAQDDGDGRLRARASRGGARAFLQKPFADHELLAAIASATGSRYGSPASGLPLQPRL